MRRAEEEKAEEEPAESSGGEESEEEHGQGGGAAPPPPVEGEEAGEGGAGARGAGQAGGSLRILGPRGGARSGGAGAAAPRKGQAVEPVELARGGALHVWDFAGLMARGAFKGAVADWARVYENDPAQGSVQLLQILCKSCSVDFHLTEEMVEAEDVDKIVELMTAVAEEEGGIAKEIYRVQRGGMKGFELHAREFWDCVVREFHLRGLLYEHNGLFDVLLDLVLAISKSKVRVFRYAAVLCGIQLVSSMVHTAQTLAATCESSGKQLKAEGGRAGRGGGARLKDLRQAVETAKHRQGHVNGLIDKLFEPMVVVRFRDVSPDVRFLIISALGEWAASYPVKFLSDHYLKYIAWSLNDVAPAVRRAAVNALRVLYGGGEENLSSLEMLTDRYGPRFVEMIQDKDDSVSLEALGLVKKLYEADLVEADKIHGLEALLLQTSVPLRQSAGALVAQTVEDAGGHQEQFRFLVRICLKLLNDLDVSEEDEQVLFDRVLDALGPHFSALEDWGLMAKVAVNEKLQPTEREAGVLLKLVQAAVQAGCSPAQVGKGRRPSKAQLERAEKTRQQFTSAFARPLLQLVRQSQPHPGRIAAVAAIIRELKLEVFSLKKQEAQFQRILESLRDTFLRSTEDLVLSECVNTIFRAMEGATGDLKDRCVEVFNDALASAADRLESTAGDVIAPRNVRKASKCNPGDPDDEKVFSLHAALLRTLHLQRLGGDAIAKSPECLKVLQSIMEKGPTLGLEEGTLALAVRNMGYLLLWNLHSLENDTDPAFSAAEVGETMRPFLQQLIDLHREAEGMELKKVIFQTSSDLLLCFSGENLHGKKSEAASAVMTEDLLSHLWSQWEYLNETDASDLEVNSYCVELLRFIRGGGAPADSSLACEIVSNLSSVSKMTTVIIKQFLAVVKRKHDEDVRVLGSGSSTFRNLCMGSLKSAFARYQESHGDASFRSFTGLGKALADIKPSADVARDVCSASLRYALEDVSERLEFLEGLGSFVHLMDKPEAEDLLSSLKAEEAKKGMEGMEDAWEPFFTFKGKVEARASGTASRATRGRKISFAGMDGGSGDEADDQAQTSGEEEEDGGGGGGGEETASPRAPPAGVSGGSAMEDISNGTENRGSPPLKRKMRDRRKSDQIMQQVQDDSGGEEEPRILRRRRRPL